MIYRIDVRTTGAARGGNAGVDPVGEALRHQIAEFGSSVGPIQTSRIFLIDTDADTTEVQRVATELLADPVVDRAELVPPGHHDNGNGAGATSRIEVHLKPGVMDPVAASTEMAIRDMGLPVKEVRTGRAYLIDGAVPREQLGQIATRLLANGVIETVHFDTYIPGEFPAGHEQPFQLRHVAIRNLDDDA